MHYVIGIDVGTTSARAALFDLTGKKYAEAEKQISIFEPKPHFVEQSSEDIWQAVCTVTRQIVEMAAVDSRAIVGIGFDATCSLVALDEALQPASVSPTHRQQQNIIVWMDHRAAAQAAQINSGRHQVLSYVGGAISPEMEVPKILWLKQHEPELSSRIAHYLDLADFLTFKATGSLSRSACTTTCKWTYLNHENTWSADFFSTLDLAELLIDNRIGDRIVQVGEAVGTLSAQAAADLGLPAGVVVCAGMIDAHAGGVGVLGGAPDTTLALITGTSACHMLAVDRPSCVPGVWGPYYGAMLPGRWLLEGGQSAAGQLVQHLLEESSQYPALQQEASAQGRSIYQALNARVRRLERENPLLTIDYHVLGYFLGNRSPLADPSLKGVVVGRSLHDDNLDALAVRYLAGLQAVAYGTRHILEVMGASGCPVQKIRMCGGGTKNPLWLREHANITGVDIEIITEPESMLLGSAMSAAFAAGSFTSLGAAMQAMSEVKDSIRPDGRLREFHNKKYQVFRAMHHDFLRYRKIMGE
ncbi:MAG: FGGY-family carbohydrate kinase [Desulfopila sp.]